MARTLLVVLVLVLLVAGLGGAFYRWIDCPDCPYMGPCLRCHEQRKISLLEARRRDPLHPDLVRLLKSRDSGASCAGSLSAQHGQRRRDVMGWKDEEEFFHYASAAQVDGPGGPLILVVLTPKTWAATEGNPCRVLLYDRGGRELDRCDASSPGYDSSPFGSLEYSENSSVVFRVQIRSDSPRGPLRIVHGPKTDLFDPATWPKDYRTRGVARIVAREGRLDVVQP